MAKEMTVAELIAALESKGLPISEEMRAEADKRSANELQDEAFHVLSGKVLEIEKEKPGARVERVTGYVSTLFDLASTVAESFTYDDKRVQGRGENIKRTHAFTVETEHGRLSVTLKRDVPPEPVPAE